MTGLRRFYMAVGASALLVWLPIAASAQSLTVGIKGGVNSSNIDFSAEDLNINFERRVGGVGGLFVGGDLGGPVGLQLEVLFSQKGTKTSTFDFDEDGSNDDLKVRVNYIEVPVLLRVGLEAGPRSTVHLYGGPAFAFKASDAQDVNGVEVDEDLMLTSNDVGVAVGVSLTSHQFVLDARYTHGLRNINDDTDSDVVEIKNRTVSVMVGFTFR